MSEPLQADSRVQLRERFSDQRWRLTNLYWIPDKKGNKVLFRPNWSQLQLLKQLTVQHLILKARKLGMSTLLNLLGLDLSLWNDNHESAIIAHENKAMEKLFRRHVKYPWDHLPQALREQKAGSSNRTYELAFSNHSSISVSLSTRSGTPNFLHISEFGKICFKYPHRATEVVTGAIESVPDDGIVVIESTAEGQHGYFYDYCQEALNRIRSAKPRRPGDWGLTFLPWYRDPDHSIDPRGIKLTPPLVKYFAKLERKLGRRFSPQQKAWYAQRWKRLGDLMWQEHPSTPEEAFQKRLEGAYYAEAMGRAREEGRITSVPYQRALRVYTWWDLGVDDETAIWFIQFAGREIHAIDFIAQSDEGLPYYAELIRKKADDRGFLYGGHIGPHDLKVREWGGNAVSRLQMARNLGINFDVVPQHSVADRIQAVRNAIDVTWFDEEHCSDGIAALEAYRKKWDEDRGTYQSKPLGDWASHPADAFGYGVMHKQFNSDRVKAQAVPRPAGWPGSSTARRQ